MKSWFNLHSVIKPSDESKSIIARDESSLQIPPPSFSMIALGFNSQKIGGHTFLSPFNTFLKSSSNGNESNT